ncbi:IclR family transcriptional regulator [Paracoccus sp. SY]|uniref:IclR family transcriptional regulator n=1 Tax=Paracoccus sp. SY TaxID=1330255 RepID=UPI000CD00347|nr:IclR family transcriptional regulator [Paracoccus sp. SY]
MPKNKTTADSPLERYFSVLEAVIASGNGSTLTEVANITGLPKPTAHRLLNALTEIGVLSHDDYNRKGFVAGDRLWRLLQLGVNPSQVTRFAQLIAHELSLALEETCYCVRYDGEKVQSIAQAISPAGYRFHVVPGDVLPFHAAAVSKVILASQPDDVVDHHLSGELTRYTDQTKTSRIDVYAELAEVRKTGFAICDREIDANVAAYAVPISLSGQPVVYALGVTGPVERILAKEAHHFVGPLMQGAERFAALIAKGEPLR